MRSEEHPMRRYMEAFLNKYNENRTCKVALSQAYNVSVWHNALYKIDTAHNKKADGEMKTEIKAAWHNILVEKSAKYKESTSSEDYENDIIFLKKEMNERFYLWFRNERFKISHSQKSLSVFLKHLWCMGKIAEPPQCPVDRTILTIAGAHLQHRGWRHVNNICEHRQKIRLLRNAAGSESLARWELRSFVG